MRSEKPAIRDPFVGGYNTFWDEYDNNAWEQKTKQIIETYVTPNSTYLDIGAWIGPTVLWGADHARRVIALEPDPAAYAALAVNTSHLDNVILLNTALWHEEGLMRMVPYDAWGSSMSRIAPENAHWYEHDDARNVRTTTIRHLDFAYQLDDLSLIKCDTEGAECYFGPQLLEYCAEHQVPLLLSLHPDWYAQDFIVDDYFELFSSHDGDGQPDNAILFLP